jgi:hypothetical protein
VRRTPARATVRNGHRQSVAASASAARVRLDSSGRPRGTTSGRGAAARCSARGTCEPGRRGRDAQCVFAGFSGPVRWRAAVGLSAPGRSRGIAPALTHAHAPCRRLREPLAAALGDGRCTESTCHGTELTGGATSALAPFGRCSCVLGSEGRYAVLPADCGLHGHAQACYPCAAGTARAARRALGARGGVLMTAAAI